MIDLTRMNQPKKKNEIGKRTQAKQPNRINSNVLTRTKQPNGSNPKKHPSEPIQSNQPE